LFGNYTKGIIKGDDIPLDPFLKGMIKGSLRGHPLRYN